MKLREKTVSRIASVLLAAVMAVSMVPAAFAAATDLEEPGTIYTPIDGTHHLVQTLCENGEYYEAPADCVFQDGNPCVCGNTKPAATDTSWCKHTKNQWMYEDLHNGTHNVVCTDCGETVSQAVPCVYTDGKCICGAEKPACDHMGQHFKFVANNNGTHNVLCADCNAVVSENVPCTYVDGKCIQCGAEKPACDHMNNNWKYVDNGDGTHKVICKDCGNVVEKNAACVYTDGKCVCGHHKTVFIPSTDDLDPSFSVSRYPICQFFQAVRQFFRSLFHRA